MFQIYKRHRDDNNHGQDLYSRYMPSPRGEYGMYRFIMQMKTTQTHTDGHLNQC